MNNQYSNFNQGNMYYNQPVMYEQKKDNSKFEVIVIIVFVAAIIAYFIFYKDSTSIKGTWACYKDGTNISLIFDENNNFEMSATSISSNLKVKGSYEDTEYRLSDEYSKEDYSYKKVKLSYDSYVENGTNINTLKDIYIIFGINENSGHLILNEDDFNGYSCTKK